VRVWFDGLSGPAVFLYFMLGFGILFGLVGRSGLEMGLVGGVVFAALMTPVVLSRRRKLGGITLLRQISLATKTGKLPGLIDPSRWLPVLASRRAGLRRSQRIGGIVFTLAGIAAALTSLEPRVDLLDSIGLAALMFVAAGVSAIPPIWRIRQITRLEGRIRADYGLPDA